jgi:hypothetical protein
MADQFADAMLEVNARMRSLHRVADTLRIRIEDNRHAPGTVIELARVASRAEYIAATRHLHRELQKLTQIVSNIGTEDNLMHTFENKAAQNEIIRAQPLLDPNSQCNLVSSSGTPASGTRRLACRDVKIIGDIAIGAVILSSTLNARDEVFAAISTGDLFYIPSWNHFAVRIAGHVFHANIGRVYRGAPPRAAGPVDRVQLECVKACTRASCDGRGRCRYYHDPEKYPKSSDTRNYMADSWLYTPAASPARYGARRIGSNELLETDLQAISDDDARRYVDQTSHDILCSLILHRYVLTPN